MKNLHKHLNKPVLGKIIQNIREQRDIKIVTNKWTKNKLDFSVKFEGSKDISNNLPILKMSENNI